MYCQPELRFLHCIVVLKILEVSYQSHHCPICCNLIFFCFVLDLMKMETAFSQHSKYDEW